MQSITSRALRILSVLAAALIVTWLSTQPQAENDYWLLARIGAWMVEHREIPTLLIFPFTEAQYFTYNAHEWLAALMLHGLDRMVTTNSLGLILGGLGLALFSAVTCMVFVNNGRHLSTALTLGLLAIAAENYRHFLRPELLTLFYLVALLTLLERLVRVLTAFHLCMLFLLVALWANSHGSFVIALPLALIFACDRLYAGSIGLIDIASRSLNHRIHPWLNSARWFLLPIVVLLASLCTPFGGDLWLFSLGFTHESQAKLDIVEWMHPLDPRSLSIIGMYPGALLAALMLSSTIWKRHTTPPRVIGVVVFFAGLATIGNRFMVYQGIVFAWAAPMIWPTATTPPSRETYRLLSLLLVLMSIALLSVRFGNMNGATPFDAKSQVLFSSPMATEIQRISGNHHIFNSYDLGGELIYRFYPKLKPSIDSRIDSYGDTYYFWHESLLDTPQKMEVFKKKWKIDYFLLTREDYLRWGNITSNIAFKCTLQATDERIYLLHCPY